MACLAVPDDALFPVIPNIRGKNRQKIPLNFAKVLEKIPVFGYNDSVFTENSVDWEFHVSEVPDPLPVSTSISLPPPFPAIPRLLFWRHFWKYSGNAGRKFSEIYSGEKFYEKIDLFFRDLRAFAHDGAFRHVGLRTGHGSE